MYQSSYAEFFNGFRNGPNILQTPQFDILHYGVFAELCFKLDVLMSPLITNLRRIYVLLCMGYLSLLIRFEMAI